MITTWTEQPRSLDYRTCRIHTPTGALWGELRVPTVSRGVILTLHVGSTGRNRFEAAARESLQQAGFATLDVDLLTPSERIEDELTHRHRFNMPMLTERVEACVLWRHSIPSLRHLPAGLLASGSGVAAGLAAAARNPTEVWAMVGRSGRPDLVASALPLVEAPTLLLATESENPRNFAAVHELPDAHLETLADFEQPGSMAHAVRLAALWFFKHLPEVTPRLTFARD